MAAKGSLFAVQFFLYFRAFVFPIFLGTYLFLAPKPRVIYRFCVTIFLRSCFKMPHKCSYCGSSYFFFVLIGSGPLKNKHENSVDSPCARSTADFSFGARVLTDDALGRSACRAITSLRPAPCPQPPAVVARCGFSRLPNCSFFLFSICYSNMFEFCGLGSGTKYITRSPTTHPLRFLGPKAGGVLLIPLGKQYYEYSLLVLVVHSCSAKCDTAATAAADDASFSF